MDAHRGPLFLEEACSPEEAHGLMMGYLNANSEVFSVTVCSLTGDSFNVECSGNMLGKDLWHLLATQKVPFGSPKTLKVLIGAEIMKLEASLAEQGLQDRDTVTLIYEDVTKAMQKAAARKVLDGCEITCEGLHAWHSITVLTDVDTLAIACPFPHNLCALSFGFGFNQSMENVALPAGLQSLTFGQFFDQSMENVALPAGLQSLTFGNGFDQRMENVALPAGLQNLTFGDDFDQSMENVALPAGLQSLTFGYGFDQSMENVVLPESCTLHTF